VTPEELNDLVECVAIKIALGNNGGTWAAHYNDEQKNVWRDRAKAIIEIVQAYTKKYG
jgi:hypothetical protein